MGASSLLVGITKTMRGQGGRIWNFDDWWLPRIGGKSAKNAI